MPANTIAPEYLGDAVYATAMKTGIENWLILTTGNHDEALADHVIYLEPEVLAALERYLVRMKEAAHAR
jgi:hypothetical protein